MASVFMEPEQGFPEWEEYIPLEDDPDDLAAVLAMAIGEVRAATEQLGVGAIAVPAWIDLMVEILTIHHLAAWMAGSVNLDPSDQEMERLIDFIAEEISFLANFQSDLESEPDGIELPGRYRSRSELYAKAVRVSYSDGVAALFGIVLPFYPADRTLCLRNCSCAWIIDEIDSATGRYDAYWVLGPTDHCPTCQARAMLQPLTISAGQFDATQVAADMYA